jgi:phage shock protein C
MTDRFLVNTSRAKVMGVCAGLADWLKIDVLAIRLAAVVAVLVSGPLAVLLYVLTGWLANDDR